MKDCWTGLKPGERPFREAGWFYSEYRYRPSEQFVRLLASHLGWSHADRVLDLGAGPAHVSVRLAPFVGEVVVMEPEEAMVEEGRAQARDTNVENLSFVVGGSDDLARLGSSLGEFAAVIISQAFHWMRDQDHVLRVLSRMVDLERGAVALVGYVKEPDYNRIWLDRSPWNRVGAILQRQLASVPERPSPAGRHDPFPDILARSPLSRVELLTYEYETVVHPSIDAALGFYYSLGNMLRRLEGRREAFEAEVRAELADADEVPVSVRLVDSALIGRRP
jgi:SAM-dependent methyltransferase